MADPELTGDGPTPAGPDSAMVVNPVPLDLAVSDEYTAAVAAGTAPPLPDVIYRLEPRE